MPTIQSAISTLHVRVRILPGQPPSPASLSISALPKKPRNSAGLRRPPACGDWNVAVFGQFAALTGPQSPVDISESPEFGHRSTALCWSENLALEARTGFAIFLDIPGLEPSELSAACVRRASRPPRLLKDRRRSDPAAASSSGSSWMLRRRSGSLSHRHLIPRPYEPFAPLIYGQTLCYSPQERTRNSSLVRRHVLSIGFLIGAIAAIDFVKALSYATALHSGSL